MTQKAAAADIVVGDQILVQGEHDQDRYGPTWHVVGEISHNSDGTVTLEPGHWEPSQTIAISGVEYPDNSTGAPRQFVGTPVTVQADHEFTFRREVSFGIDEEFTITTADGESVTTTPRDLMKYAF